jgi:hypothetical protein
MSVGLTLASKGGGAVFAYLRSLLDPGLRRQLDEEITNHVLSEIPRIVRVLEARIHDVSASGCSVHEANIIAHQVLEAQRRTIDDDKRRRLSNVLINGLCSPAWSKALHRLLVRLTSELEEEHIAVLRWYAATPEERNALDALENEPSPMVETAPGVKEWRPTAEHRKRWDLHDALVRELVSRALVLEIPTPKITRPTGEPHSKAVNDVELDWNNEIAPLGLTLLEHLRDPELPDC